MQAGLAAICPCNLRLLLLRRDQVKALWELECALTQIQGVRQPAHPADGQSVTQPTTIIPVSAAAPDGNLMSHTQENSLQPVHICASNKPAGQMPELAIHSMQGADVAPVSCLVGAYIRWES